jgi:dienelactone hydrolase
VPIDEALLRHLYRYDRTLPLLPTSEPETVIDMRTLQPVAGLRRERVTFGSTHDQRVLATLTYPASGAPFAAILLQHGSTPMGRHSWQTRPSGPLHVALAQAGFMTVAVDAYGFGSRETPDDRGRLRSDRPDLLFRTRDQRMQAVQDLMRTVDYLLTRDDVRPGAIGYLGVSMGCRIGVPFFALDPRVAAGAFFVGGTAPYSRFAVAGTPFADLAADEQLAFELTDPITFAPLTAGRPVFMANGTRDELVTKEGGERLQAAMAEPKTLRWFDGGHAQSPPELFDEARDFLASHLGVRVQAAAR